MTLAPCCCLLVLLDERLKRPISHSSFSPQKAHHLLRKLSLSEPQQQANSEKAASLLTDLPDV